jgi:hypothetical protein
MTRIVLTALVLLDCVAFGTELFAQAGQTINPVPITPPTLNTATTTCQTNCDTQAMFCQNLCSGEPRSKSCSASEQRRLQSQLHYSAACLQTAVLISCPQSKGSPDYLRRGLQGGVDAPRDQSALDPRIRIPNAEISQGADRDRARPMTSS